MVVDTRTGMDTLQENLAFMGRNPLKVGWLSQPDPLSKGTGTGGDRKKDDDGTQSEATVAEVAFLHEFFIVKPPRSVLVNTIEQDTLRIEEGIGEFIGPVIEGDIDAKQGLGLLGAMVVDLMKRRYVSQAGFRPLSAERKRQKRRAGKSGDQARINFGQEINSLRFQIGDR